MSQKIPIGPDPLLIIWFSHEFQIFISDFSKRKVLYAYEIISLTLDYITK